MATLKLIEKIISQEKNEWSCLIKNGNPLHSNEIHKFELGLKHTEYSIAHKMHSTNTFKKQKKHFIPCSQQRIPF